MLFFFACWFGAFVADLFISTDFGNVGYALIESPWSWVGNVLDGGVDGIGFLIFPVLAVAFAVVLYSEMGYWHGLFLILIATPIQSLWLSWRRYDEVPVPTFVLFSVYLVFVFWLYARCLVCSRVARG